MTLTTNYYFLNVGRIILETKQYSIETKHYVKRASDSNHFTWNWNQESGKYTFLSPVSSIFITGSRKK